MLTERSSILSKKKIINDILTSNVNKSNLPRILLNVKDKRPVDTKNRMYVIKDNDY